MLRQKSNSDPHQILQEDEDDNYSTGMIKNEENEKDTDNTFLTGAQVDQKKKIGKIDLNDPENLESIENSTLLVE